MANRRSIYPMSTGYPMGVEPRIKVYESDDGPYVVLRLTGLSNPLAFGVHTDAEGLRAIRDVIDAFLSSPDGRRLAAAESPVRPPAEMVLDSDGIPIVPASERASYATVDVHGNPTPF